MIRRLIYKDKTIVITQIRLHDYAGSEIVTLELANHFLDLGMNVIVATHTFGGAIKKEFLKLKSVRVITSNQNNFSKILQETEIDYVWVHHQYVPEPLINKQKVKFIYHHMSPYVELESPLFWRVEEGLADVILFNSLETKDRYISEGYFNGRVDRLAVFGNPAPLDFYRTDSAKKASSTSKLGKVLIVSNHPPQELEEARTLLEEQGVSVLTFGSVNGGKACRVLPEHIKDVDVVITIGKTVQYAMAVGVPVYCYDHFGGPGYLSKKNYSLAKNLNFSGRGFKKKSAKRIVDDIISHYNIAAKFSVYAREELSAEFKLDLAINNVFEILSKTNTLTPKQHVQELDILSHLNNMRIIERNIRGVAEIQSETINHLTGKIANLEADTESLIIQVRAKENQIQSLQQSISYRLGLSLLAPLLATRSAIRRIKKKRY